MRIARHRISRGGALLLVAATLHPLFAVAQSTPGRPIRLIVTSAPGGPADVQGRLLVPMMTEMLGSTVVVDNRPSSNGVVGMEIAARAVPDGLTLVIGNSGTVAINATLYTSLAYDPERDFTPITQMSTTGMIVAGHPRIPGNTIQDLAAYAKTRKGGLNIAIPGSTGEAAGDALWRQLGVRMTNVHYKGSAPSERAVVSGEADVSLLTPLASAAHLKTGQMKAFGITSAERSPVLPEVPSLIEQGITGYDIQFWSGLLAPAKTPPAIVARTHKAAVEALNSPEVRDRFRQFGLVLVGNTPTEFRAIVQRDIAKFRRIIIESGMPRL
jgi:tripartite-type tricarboxylate transporter receptor subunit TctC